MNAEELRLGNYVYSKSCNCNFPKGVIKVDFEAFRKIHLFDGLSGLEPIELTEEWLLKFGFYKVKNSSLRYSYRDDNWLFNNFWINEDFFPCIENYGDDCMNIIGLKLHYVHQLQNLYFALTGEELVVSDAVS